MHDRDSISELIRIVRADLTREKLDLALSALPYIESKVGGDYDIYYRRRLSVCRTLTDMHLPVDEKQLDIMVCAALLNHMPDDHIPADHDEVLGKLFEKEPEIDKLLKALKQTDYKDLTYYDKVIMNPYALLIRLAERSVLVEKLYEWHPTEALRFARETRESFFPMCLYLKEHYPEFLGAASIIHEKMRNLTTVNEALLTQFMEIEYSISDEILALREENASIRSMIAELKEDEE